MDSSPTPNDNNLPSWRKRIRSVLTEAGGPLHISEIARRIAEAGLDTGHTPERTISYELNNSASSHLFERIGEGIYALRSQIAPETESKRIVKIAPGGNAKYWDECHTGGYICVGWPQIKDLNDFASKDDYLKYADEKLEQDLPHKPKRTEKANELWTFRELRPGDIVLANRGTSEILGVGDVVEPGYYWNSERQEYNHCVAVRWRSFEARAIPPQKNWAFKTIASVSQQLYRGIVTDSLSSAEEGRHVWLFQANVNHYNLKEKLANMHVGDKEEWTVTRYKDQMNEGDIVLLWQSGHEAGIYAVAEIIEPPYEHEVDFQATPWLFRMGNEATTGWWVQFQITHILEAPLLRSLPPAAHDATRPALTGHPVLKDFGVIRSPQETNYKVTPSEWKALKSLLGWETLTGYWWVNQGDNYQEERDRGILYATKHTSDGRIVAHHSNMSQIRAGDRIIHYANGEVRALGTVLESAQETWELGEDTFQSLLENGYVARVRYDEISPSIPRESIPSELRTLGSNAKDGGPFTIQGKVKQGYLFSVSSEIFEAVQQLASGVVGVEEEYTMPSFDHIRDDVERAGLRLDETTLRRYHLSLQTRGFVILSGQSGTGKTWLSELYARATGANCQIVAVAPNWTTNEDLLGYYNPLSKSYQETEFGRFVRAAAAEFERAEAAKQAARPYHLVLDEMNLARVEYYFAKFLSALEVRARYDSATIDLGHDQTLTLSPNLFFIGTVNVDETTHGFADKVYDRAQLIELTASRADLFAHIGEVPWREPLMEVWDAVHEVAPFAFRVLEEIRLYIEAAAKMGVPWEEALDEQILQKILPKVKGSEPRVEDGLQGLMKHCEKRFPLSHGKATEILGRYRSSGFASFF